MHTLIHTDTHIHLDTQTDVQKVRIIYSSTKLEQNIQCHKYCQNT